MGKFCSILTGQWPHMYMRHASAKCNFSLIIEITTFSLWENFLKILCIRSSIEILMLNERTNRT